MVWPAGNWSHLTVILPPLTVTLLSLQSTIGLGNSMPGISLIAVTEVDVRQSFNGRGPESPSAEKRRQKMQTLTQHAQIQDTVAPGLPKD